MSIRNIGSDLIRSFGPKGLKGVERSTEGEASDETRRVDRSDRVELSHEGRALAAKLGGQKEVFDAGRAAEIRARIDSGVYNDPSVAEQVARRLMASGDLAGE